MKLPNGERAVVEDSKLREYVLNPLHPVGRHHAILFENLLGISLDNVDLLKAALLDAAANEDVTLQTLTPHGRKFQMRFELV